MDSFLSGENAVFTDKKGNKKTASAWILDEINGLLESITASGKATELQDKINAATEATQKQITDTEKQ